MRLPQIWEVWTIFHPKLRVVTSQNRPYLKIFSRIKKRRRFHKFQVFISRHFTICRDILSTLARAFGKRFWPVQSYIILPGAGK